MQRTFLLVVLISLSSLARATNEAAAPIEVTFLHVNDVYQFMPVEGGKKGALARLLTLKKQALKRTPHVVFTLGGDTLSPSAETRVYKGAHMIDAWNAVGLDYAVFGNHEFDLKKPDLLARIEESRFTWLGANIIDRETGTRFAGTPEFVVREFDGAKIGLIGLILPETRLTSAGADFVEIADFCLTANLIVSRLRRVEKVDAVIGLTHLFMRQDKALAGCAEFDLILGGHEHTRLQASVDGTPIFKMAADARELGQFTLSFDPITKKLLSIDWTIIPVTDAIPDAPEFAPVVDKYRHLIDELDVRIGATAVTLDGLSLSNRQRETNLGNFIADSYRAATDADIGFLNGGSIRSDLTYYPGVLTRRDVLSILPFNNPIMKIEVTGEVLLRALEHGVARSAEDDQPGRFPQVSGMTFAFDAAAPAGKRITAVTVGDATLDETRTYTLATSDFLVTRGGDGYTMFGQANVLIDADSAKRDAEIFEAAIQSAPSGVIAPKIEGRINRRD
jgi:5'-nucleotidase